MDEIIVSNKTDLNTFDRTVVHAGYVSFEFSILDKMTEDRLMRMISVFLSRIDRPQFLDQATTVAKELITNAVKANAKRLYFRNSGLDIHNPDDYRKGMLNFKTDVLVGYSSTLQALSETDMRVCFSFIVHRSGGSIIVENNIPIVEEELKKISTRVEKAYQYRNISEAFTDMMDNSEGAGLGLIMVIMVFRNSGFNRDDFEIKTDKEKTRFIFHFRARNAQQPGSIGQNDAVNKEMEFVQTF